MLYTIPTKQMLRQQMRVSAITKHTLVLTPCQPLGCASITCCQAMFGKSRTNSVTLQKSQLADNRVVQLGDKLEATINYRHYLFIILLLYGLPLMLLLIAAGTAHSMGYGDVAAALAGGLGLLFGFVTARCVTKHGFLVTYLRIS